MSERKIDPIYLMTDEEKTAIYKKYRLLTGNAEGLVSDALLDIKLEIIVAKIVVYCNREDLPVRLHSIIAELLSRVFPQGYSSQTGGQLAGALESVSIGGATVKLSSGSSSSTISGEDLEDIFISYKNALDVYRKVGLFRRC